MFRSHQLVLTALVAALGCSDSPTYAGLPYTGEPTPQPDLIGTVVVEFTSGGPEIRLLQATGESTLLLGAEAQPLIKLTGVEVRVRGGWVASGPPFLQDELMNWAASMAFSVDEFVVLAVEGRAALDGVLFEVDGHYALHSSDGSIHSLDDGVAELGVYIGSRIWVTGSGEHPPFRYGVIL